MQAFEEQFNCFVEPVPPLELIRVHTEQKYRAAAEREFRENVLEKTRLALIQERLEVPFINSQKIVLQKGGSILQFLNDRLHFKILVSNLPAALSR